MISLCFAPHTRPRAADAVDDPHCPRHSPAPLTHVFPAQSFSLSHRQRLRHTEQERLHGSARQLSAAAQLAAVIGDAADIYNTAHICNTGEHTK